MLKGHGQRGIKTKGAEIKGHGLRGIGIMGQDQRGTRPKGQGQRGRTIGSGPKGHLIQKGYYIRDTLFWQHYLFF